MLLERLLDLAVQSVFRRRLRSGITLVSVAIGTAGLLLFLSVAFDLQQQLQVQLGDYQPASVLHVDPPLQAASSSPTSGPPPGIDDATLSKLRGIPNVRDVFAEVQVGGTARLDNADVPLELRPVPIGYLSGGAGVNLVAGKLFADNNAHELVVTTGVLQFLANPSLSGGPAQANVASAVLTPNAATTATRRAAMTPASAISKSVEFTPQTQDGRQGQPLTLQIVGVIDGRSPFAYVPYSTGMALVPADPNSPTGSYDAAVVEVAGVQQVAAVRQAITGLGLHVETPELLSQSLSSSLTTARLVAAFVAIIALALAVINITNTLLSAVAERTREIGIMKAIGARDWHVGLLFLLESLLLGAIGGVVGGLIALAIARIVTSAFPIQLADAPALTLHVPLYWLGLALLAVTLLSGVAGLLPALRAARTDPAGAIAGTH